MRKKILTSLAGEFQNIPPVWLMRQAGRYLSEYKEVRKTAGTFLDLCYNPELASEVTLQPIRRFGYDAAIIFSDILVIPHAMGVGLEYLEGEGPKLEKINSSEKIDNLDIDNISSHLKPVFEALKRTKEQLPNETTLIGFAGAPWTVSTYMIAGAGKKYDEVKDFARENKQAFDNLMEKLTNATIEYLLGQIDAGAEVVQIFDSWATQAPEESFSKLVIEPVAKITAEVKNKHPDFPVIGFPKGVGDRYEEFVKHTGVDGVSIDYNIDVNWAAEKLQPHVCVQGNLDPEILAGDNKDRIITETKKIIEALNNGPFIFNLGHGILPHTPLENVELLLETIRG